MNFQKDTQIEIHIRNMELTDAIESYVNKKVAKFIRHLPVLDLIRVDLSHEKNARDANERNVAQITLSGKRILLRSEERAADLNAAIDVAVDKMDRQIRRYKGKHWDKKQAQPVVPDDYLDYSDLEDLEEEETAEIVRHKTFTLYPMNEYEALEQMKLLGHENFFIFYNANTSKVNVLYKRRNDTYGLIDPEVG
jgi:putative sigma-54 modulation protein